MIVAGSATSTTCPRCGSEMPSAFVGRVCAHCLLTSVLPGNGGPDAPAHDGEQPAATRLPETLKTGERFGDYELVDVLGRGGMAVVYLARQISLDRLVALKTVETCADADVQTVERFRREARAISRLDHPNIVSVRDVGTLAGALYYTMEHIEGKDLGKALHDRWFTARESVGLMLKVTEAISYAHSRGVIHRDLKPGNILLDPGGEPHVADFGLAIEVGQGGRLTLTGDFLGTPAYVPPERIDGKSGQSEPAGDVYALGAILFQMLTGRAPFVGGSPSEILHAVMHGQAPSPRLLNPNVSRDLETICLKCLEREPTRRYPTALALAEDLRRVLDGRPITARPVSAPGRFVRWCRRKPAFAAIWFLLLLLTAGSMLAAVALRRGELLTRQAFMRIRSAETDARERLREAKIAEARAIRRTVIPGHRQQALDALAEAARIRPGPDLRDEALAAMLLFDGRRTGEWDLHLDNPNSITVDPAGTVAAIEGRNIVAWARNPAKLIRWGEIEPFVTLSAPETSAIGPMRFSRDGKLLMARYADDALRVWRVGEAEPFLLIPHRALPGGKVRTELFNGDYDFTPDGGSLVLGLPGGGVSLHRIADKGAETGRWQNGGEMFNVIMVSPDGHLLAAANLLETQSRTVQILTLPDLRLIQSLHPAGLVGSLARSSDSRVLAVGLSDGYISSYDVRDWHPLPRIAAAINARDIHFLGHDRLLASQDRNSVHLANVALGSEDVNFQGVGASGITVHPGGDQLYVASSANVISRLEVETPPGIRSIPPPRAAGCEVLGNTFSLDFSPDGRWVVTANLGLLFLFDVESGRLLCELDTGERRSDNMGSVMFAPDGYSVYRCSVASPITRYPVLVGADNEMRFGSGEPADAEREAGFIIADQCADRRRLALMNFATGAVRVATVEENGQLQTVSRWNTPGIYNASFNPDGTSLLTNCTSQGPSAAAQRIRLYRVSDGSVLREFPGRVSCDTAWSADGRTAITSRGGSETVLWDSSDWHPRTVLKGELGGDVTTFAISPDNEYFVVNHDNRIHFVSVRDGTLLATFECPGASGFAASVRFLPDGKRFAIFWRDGRIDLVDPQTLRAGLSKLGLDW